MSVAPIPRLCVPAGTAAACVVASEPLPEPALEARRYRAIAPLPDAERLLRLKSLVRDGVRVELAQAVLVLRISTEGSRHHAAIVSIDPDRGMPGGGLTAEPFACAASPGDACESLRTALAAEARQRPVFHGTTAEGITYSGFLAAEPQVLLEAVAAALPQQVPASVLAAVFPDAVHAVPPGLLIALGPESP